MLTKSEVKYIQSLYQKKFREREKLFVIEGPKILEEALHTIAPAVKKIYALAPWAAVHQPAWPDTAIIPVSEQELHRISGLQTPHQVLALVQQEAADRPFPPVDWALALDGIQDPGNLGTIIRIADWYNVPLIVCSPNCADMYNPKVVQASMGSIFRTAVFYADLGRWLASQPSLPVYGALLQGEPLKSVSPANKGIVLIGNESKGIAQDLMPHITQKITIERRGNAESLNAAVATGIILSHLK